MDTLPNELLQEILRLSVDDKPPVKWVNNITLVCSRWKSAAVTCPFLWTNIETTSCTLNGLARQLSLAGDLPIRVNFNGRRVTQDPKYVEALVGEGRRISEIRFEPENIGETAHIMQDDDDVHVSRPAFGSLNVEVALESILRASLNLRNLALGGVLVPWDKNFANLIHSLRRLELDLWEEAPMDALLTMLSQCPDLEDLVLLRSSPSDHDRPVVAPVRTVALPKLTHLEIYHYSCCVSWFLSHITPNERIILEQRSTIDVRLEDKEWTRSMPVHNRDSWPIFARARHLRVQLSDEYHILVDAWSKVMGDVNDPVEEGPYLEMNFHNYGLESKVQHLLVTALPDVADMFASALVTHLVVDAWELPEDLTLLNPDERLEDVQFTPGTWHATLSRFPLLEFLELRERDVVKPLFQSISKPRMGDGALLCPKLNAIVLAMDTFDEETISAVFMSCAVRASQGMRLASLKLEVLGRQTPLWNAHLEKLQSVVDHVILC